MGDPFSYLVARLIVYVAAVLTTPEERWKQPPKPTDEEEAEYQRLCEMFPGLDYQPPEKPKLRVVK